METFLEALDALIADQDLSIIEVLGALQITQQRIALDALLVDEEEDDEA